MDESASSYGRLIPFLVRDYRDRLDEYDKDGCRVLDREDWP